MYVYIESEHNSSGSLWTVGFYDPQGNWRPESDHDNSEKAAERVAWLNGSQQGENNPYLLTDEESARLIALGKK